MLNILQFIAMSSLTEASSMRNASLSSTFSNRPAIGPQIFLISSLEINVPSMILTSDFITHSWNKSGLSVGFTASNGPSLAVLIKTSMPPNNLSDRRPSCSNSYK
ncbi:hypothetical protein ES332_A13G114500v1 [Gossypium tomentosum]|uniref:Uncharacterized protein n=1 Tax=Gossypium tomentosum TaxID=34277 RepID=A0A5D2MIS9_GOSTO|nr:hypothetical protein ES332_A13G114500v1 [Gossypium tomentosum]